MRKNNRNTTDWGNVIIIIALLAATVITYAISVLGGAP